MDIHWPFSCLQTLVTLVMASLALSPGHPLRAPLGSHCCCGAGIVHSVSGKLQRGAAHLQELQRDLGHLGGHLWGSYEIMRSLSSGRSAWVSGLQHWAHFPGSVIQPLAPRGALQTPTMGPGMCQGPKRSHCWPVCTFSGGWASLSEL